MKTLLIIAVLIVVASCHHHKKPSCPEGEKWNDCASACPKTCKEPKGPEICHLKCVAGCECEEGLVRNYDNKCVPIKKC